MTQPEEDRALVPKDELAATIAARHELGAEMEPQMVDAFVQRIERRIDERIDKRLKLSRQGGREGSFVLALVSLGVAVPLLGIAVSHGIAAVIVVCAALVLVNAIYQRL